MKSWKMILSVTLAATMLFLLGVGVGAAGAHRFYQKRVREMVLGQPESVRQMVLRAWNRKLGLTPSQQAGVDAALRDAQREFRALRAEVQPRVAEILQRAESRVREQLEPEQRAKFDRMISQHKKRWQRADAD